MISEIRQHVREVMKSIDSSYLENERPFEVPGNVARPEKEYHLEIGASAKEVEDEQEGVVTDITATLRLYAQGGSKKLDTFDEAYCTALIVNAKILDKTLLNNRDYIKGITTSNVEPSEIDGSQDLYSFETTLIFKIGYSIGE